MLLEDLFGKDEVNAADNENGRITEKGFPINEHLEWERV